MLQLSSYGWHEAIGALGVVLYLSAYLLLQMGRLQGDGYWYAGLNLLASSCVLISLINAFNLSSALINSLWVAISLGGLIRIYRLNRAVRFGAEEQRFLTATMPTLSRTDARALLDRAMITQTKPGSELTRQGAPIDHLVYLLDGVADVRIDGRSVAALGPDAYVGDVTYRTGEPATATVTVSEPGTCVFFEIGALRRFLAKNPRARTALDASTAEHLGRKLRAANARSGQGVEGAEVQPEAAG
ncbi:MAG: cyclic nucleotide-binding domain-containing protein [Pseudomonadota bacterium]